MTRASVQFLHRALDVVGGAEILLADQARFLLEHGAAPRVRALVHAPSAWEARLGGVPVDAWRTCAPGEPRPRRGRAGR